MKKIPSLSSARLPFIVDGIVASEKASSLSTLSKYVLRVASNANKTDIRKAIQKIFSVDVLSVAVMRVKPKKKFFRGKLGVRSGFKKAIVSLKAGQVIDGGGNLGS